MDAPLPQGCTGYQEGMRLTKDSPFWLWKLMRKHLAKGDGRNKAGRMLGKGTISLTRKKKRKRLQPNQPETENPGPAYDWDGRDSWEREWWANEAPFMTGLPRTGVMAPGRARGGLGDKAPVLLQGPDSKGHSHPCKGERAAP